MTSKAEVTQWEEEAHKRLAEAEERQRAADRCARDGSKARRELERLKKAVESGFEDLQRQVGLRLSSHPCISPFNLIPATTLLCQYRNSRMMQI